MVIIQFQIVNTTDEEQNLLPLFCNWLKHVVFSEVDTKINRKKISLRLNYILEKAKWVNWGSNKYNLTVVDILNAIYDSICVEQYRKNIWKIKINNDVLIPYSSTSVSRFIRFLNYGDNEAKGTGIFTNLEHKYNHNKLNSLWQLFCATHIYGMSSAKIITRN